MEAFFLAVAGGCILAAVLTAYLTIQGLRYQAHLEEACTGDFLLRTAKWEAGTLKDEKEGWA